MVVEFSSPLEECLSVKHWRTVEARQNNLYGPSVG